MEKVLDYARKFKAQDPIILPRGGPQTLEALVAGQAPLAVIQLDRVLRAKLKDKAPVDFVWLSPISVTRFWAFAVKKVRHPNAAMLLAGYLGTPEASRLMEEASFRTQFGPSAQTDLARMLRGGRRPARVDRTHAERGQGAQEVACGGAKDPVGALVRPRSGTRQPTARKES